MKKIKWILKRILLASLLYGLIVGVMGYLVFTADLPLWKEIIAMTWAHCAGCVAVISMIYLDNS